jgi:hypothetical protein
MNAGDDRMLSSRAKAAAESLKSVAGTSIIAQPFDFLA